MFDIFIDTHFAGGHHLRDYPGNCETPHGHNWKVRVTVRATKLDHLGMGVDFTVVKRAVKETLKKIDHKNLNELPMFQKENPSSENIAIFIYNDLKDELNHERYRLYSVTVKETDFQGLTYYGPSQS
jgi:6-pyruvoyltetrahydropterin/6-carboxytetrahydropterin synthase